MPSQKILVTGGAGFIGSNLVDHLLGLGHEVVCLDDLSTGFEKNIEHNFGNPDFRFIKGDIRDMETCREAVKGCDYVSHQAALGSVPRSIEDPVNTNSVNINGFLNILVTARDEKVKRFVYAASSSTYGDSKKLPKVEEEIGKPLSPYAITKYVNELYADVFAKTYGMQCIGLRYFNVFGKRQDPNGAYAAVIPLWVKNLLNHERPVINGDGSYSRDFTYIDNVLQANEKALFTPCEQILKGQREYYNLELEEHKYLMQSAESGEQRAEVGGQRSEVSGQMSEVGEPSTEYRVESTESRGQKSEVRSQSSEVKSESSEVKSESSEFRVQSSEFGDKRVVRTGDSGLEKSMEVTYNQSSTTLPEAGRQLPPITNPQPLTTKHQPLNTDNFFFHEVFNIAFGSNTTLNQLYSNLQDNLSNFDTVIIDIKPAYGPFRVGDIPHSQASILKAKTILGYCPKFDAKKGFKMASEWYSKNL